jgi:hypothetical protein
MKRKAFNLLKNIKLEIELPITKWSSILTVFEDGDGFL